MLEASSEILSVPLSNSKNEKQLVDSQGRLINYLRLAITDRCNLRCRYCMPDGGVPFVPHSEILTFEELERLVLIFSGIGIDKIRVTGGEPFARKNCMNFLRHISSLETVKSFHVTTNGVAAAQYVRELKELGITGINLSLDSLDRKRFWSITSKDKLSNVLDTMHEILRNEVPLKINTVILDDTSDDEILKMGSIASDNNVSVRFIEKMPFSGADPESGDVSVTPLLTRLEKVFPTMEEIKDEPASTARLFRPKGFSGKIGIIEGFSRHFCGTCNKVRITPQGMLKTCLYDDGVLDLKSLLRSEVSDEEIQNSIKSCVLKRLPNGHVTEKMAARENQPSMASIGG